MKSRQTRKVRTVRFSDAELATIREGAAAIGMNWTTFVRCAALTVVRQRLTPAMVEVDGESIALMDDSPEPAP